MRGMPPPPPAPLDDSGIPSVWRSLGLPGLIDVHTHFMPDNVLAKVWADFDHFAEAGLSWSAVYRYDEERRLRLLREFGVRRFTALLYPHRPDMAEWVNGVPVRRGAPAAAAPKKQRPTQHDTPLSPPPGHGRVAQR